MPDVGTSSDQLRGIVPPDPALEYIIGGDDLKCLKAFGFLLLSCFLFFGLSPLKQVKADIYINEYPNVLIGHTNGYMVDGIIYSGWVVYAFDNSYSTSLSQSGNNIVLTRNQYIYVDYPPGNFEYSHYGPFFNESNGAIAFATTNVPKYGFGRIGLKSFDSVIILKNTGINIGNISLDTFFPSLEDYEESIQPKPTWWEILKENAQRVVRDIANILGIGSAIDAAIDLDNWLGDLFTVKVGEGELERWQIDVDPPPSPTPTPTPIPYQTVMTPDNNGGFTIQYIYNNPSGTPEVHPQPPANVTNTTNNYGDDFEYPYYENPENKDNPFRLKIPWYLKLILNNNDIPIETLDDHYDVAQYQVQSDDVLEAVDTVYDGFQVIPADWLLLLGAIACLPLFAALLHRMLSG